MSTVKLNSDTLSVSPSPGEIEYNGRLWATDSSSRRNLLSQPILLATAVTTSGTSVVVSGLDLTPYSQLKLIWNAVSNNASTQPYTINGTIATKTITSAGTGFYGITYIDLASSLFTSSITDASTSASTFSAGESVTVGKLNITNASTSITFSHSSGTAVFDFGSIDIYGVP